MNAQQINTTFLVLTKDCPNVAKLLGYLAANKDKDDNIVVLDDFSTPENVAIYKQFPIRLVQHALNGDYAAHRNFALDKCRGNYIFALDDDEIPTENLMKGYKAAILNTGRPDLIGIPRMNLFAGALPIDALRYGWDVTYLETIQPVINWQRGDIQTRLFRNKRGLRWKNKLHECIYPAPEHKVIMLPKDEKYCILHLKTIETQRAANERYNKLWTVEENKLGGSYAQC